MRGEKMIVFGADTHKTSHTISAVDELGRVLDSITIENNLSGYQKMYEWFLRFESDEKITASENTGSLGKSFTQFLLKKRVPVYEVTPRLTAKNRNRILKNEKSDYLDSIAIALSALREREKLHKVQLEDTASNYLKELSRFRKRLVQQRTKLINQLHKALFKLDTEYKLITGNLGTDISIEQIKKYYLKSKSKKYTEIENIYRCEIKSIINSLKTIEREIKVYEKKITEIMKKEKSTITTIPGIGLLRGASILGEIGDISEIKNGGQIANKGGICPKENSSSKNKIRMVNPGGNRLLNSDIHELAVYLIGHDEISRAYYNKKKSESMTSKEALRCLKRRLCDIIYAVLKKNSPYKKPDNLINFQPEIKYRKAVC